MKRADPEGPAFLNRYRQVLVRESRHILNRDPAILFFDDPVEEEGYPLHRAQRGADRIFEKTNRRLLSQIVDGLVENTPPLRSARDYIEGIRFDLVRGGGVKVRGGRADGGRRDRDDESEGVAASLGVVMTGNPRIEMRAMLPGRIRTRVEVPLTSAGFRTSLSRRFTHRMRGTLSGGVEDSGEDRWVSAGVEIRF